MDFHNIIVRMPNWVGDLVMGTPILEDIKRKWPSAKLTAMCQYPAGQLLSNDPNIDEIFTFKRPSGWLHRDASRHILNPLRHGGYDLGILLTNSFSSAWWFWRGGVKNRIGFEGNLRSPLLSKAVPFPEDKEAMHLVNVYKQLLVPLDIPLSDTPPKLYVSYDEANEAKMLLRRFKIPEGAKIIGINPGAAYGTAKCWLPERFAETAKKLLSDPETHILFFGDTQTAPLVKDICRGLPERAIDLSGKTDLRELMALIEHCDVFLTNDSGPMHIASALGTKIVALFGSTSDIKTGPYNGGTVIHKRPSCSPCYKRVCPIDFRCMKEITVDEVCSEIRKVEKG
jgi:heptosyltransferase II